MGVLVLLLRHHGLHERGRERQRLSHEIHVVDVVVAADEHGSVDASPQRSLHSHRVVTENVDIDHPEVVREIRILHLILNAQRTHLRQRVRLDADLRDSTEPHQIRRLQLGRDQHLERLQHGIQRVLVHSRSSFSLPDISVELNTRAAASNRARASLAADGDSSNERA